MRHTPSIQAKLPDQLRSFYPVVYDPPVVAVKITGAEPTLPTTLLAISTQLPSLVDYVKCTSNPLLYLSLHDAVSDLASIVDRICSGARDTQVLEYATQKFWDSNPQLSVDRYIVTYGRHSRTSKIYSIYLRRFSTSTFPDSL